MTVRSDFFWYKDAIIYEVHVRAFYDSVKDGIGDFPGLTQKLDYLQDLGVTAIWLLPFYPSPLKDDGYDIASYTDVHKSYGTLKDFQRFLREAHRRGLRVISELVLNHTSDQHVWFERSRRAAPGSRWRNFYVWSDTPERYADARIIFKDFETSNWTWDPIAKAYYWHRFYSHQPDLNWENPEVRDAMFGIMDFWFDMGVDGLRLDAVPYLFEREGTDCENLPETHAALRDLRAHVDQKYRDRMLLAEANQWPEEAVAYFGQGDECHMAFHFPVMPRLFQSLRMEDRYPITDILRLTPQIPENCQWAMFLRNHDELTLEMVTDEERDYMYRSYAMDREMRINLGIRRRLAPLLENDRRKIELMNAVLFSLPGTPVVYYGDEIGMGDNIYLGDRNGMRTPMQWSADRNAGFSKANPQRLYLPVNIDPEYHYEAVNVDTQRNNPHSLYWWMKRLIAQRKQFRAFGSGSLEFLYPNNRKVLAFVRQFQDERVLVLANLSRFAQFVELDLTRFAGMIPVEVFGRTQFPPVTEQPYVLSLGPYAFYWFHMERREAIRETLAATPTQDALPVITVESLENAFDSSTLRQLERMLPPRLRQRPWFLRRRCTVRSVAVRDVLQLAPSAAVTILFQFDYSDADSETYAVSLSLGGGERAEALLRDHPEAVLARVECPGVTMPAVIYGAVYDRDFSDALLKAVIHRRRFHGLEGDLTAGRTRSFHSAWKMVRSSLDPLPRPAVEPSSYINLGEDFVLKLYRLLEPGIHPDREIEEFLTEHTEFRQIPRALGWLEYVDRDSAAENPQTVTLGILTSFVRNGTNGWSYTLDHLGLFFERALALSGEDPKVQELARHDVHRISRPKVPEVMTDLLGGFADSARILGRRTAELHIALASHPEIPDFAPEPFTEFYRHGLYHGMLAQVNRTLDGLRERLHSLSEAAQRDCRALLAREAELRSHLQRMRDTRISGARIRHHGNFHLGEVLFTGNDVVIANFEGEITRPMSERRIKRTCIRDVASMVTSFHYAAHAVLYGHVPGIVVAAESHPALQFWAHQWSHWSSAIFLDSYLEVADGAEFLPRSLQQREILFEACLLEKELMEIEYELEHRPDWIRIPVRGVLEQLGIATSDPETP